MKTQNKILTLEEARNQPWFWNYGNGIYEYKDEKGYCHLVINGEDVLEGKKAVLCHYYGKGIYKYTDEGGYYRLVINGEDVLEGKNATWCNYYGKGIYKYTDEDEKFHEIDINAIKYIYI
jgi:hypothetical protein